MDTWTYKIIAGIIDGITIGSVYALMALGLSLVFGVTRAYNFGHGSFFTWGAYLAWVLQDMNYVVIFAIVIPVMFFFGWGFEKIIVSPLRKRPNWMINVLITTLASAIVLDNLALAVFGPYAKTLPLMFSGAISVGNFTLGLNDIAVLAGFIIIVSALTLFLGKTRGGRAMRAVAQDLMGARIVGISESRVFGYSFGISAVMSGIAGILLSHKYSIFPMGGWTPFIKSFVVVFLGGLGSFKGTVSAAFILGIVEALVALYIGSVWVMPVWFVVLILLLILRPKGLFGIWE